LSSEANGSFSFHSGCCGASDFTRSSAKRNWKYIGCSAQSVPSLSNTAMRSAGGTKSGPPSLVTFATNSTTDFLAAPSFQDGSGPAPPALSSVEGSEVEGSAAWAMVVVSASAHTSAAAMRFCTRMVFIVGLYLGLIGLVTSLLSVSLVCRCKSASKLWHPVLSWSAVTLSLILSHSATLSCTPMP